MIQGFKIPHKQIEELPTTRIIKYLPQSKTNRYYLRKSHKQTIKPKRNLKDQIIYIAQKLNSHDEKSEQNNAQIETIKNENEEFKADLKKTNKNNPLIENSALKSCQDLIQQYQEKNYKIPDLNSNHNLFESNPLIQTEKDIKRFYDIEINKTGYIENLDSYKEKNKKYLLKLQLYAHKLKEKGPQSISHQGSITKQATKIINANQLITLNETDEKTNKKLQIENDELKNEIKNTIQTIQSTVTASVQRKKTTPCIKHLRNKPNEFNDITNTTNTNYNTRQSINISTLPSPANKHITKKPITTIHRTSTLDVMNYRNSLPVHPLDHLLPELVSVTERVNTDINERPRKDVISELYDFVQKTDYTTYVSCIKNYQMKYQKNKGGYNAHVDKSSQGFTHQLFNHFTHVKNIISNSNEKEACSNCYSRIGKKDKVESKLLKLHILDNQLKKFNYFFIKKKIINEKSN